MSENRRETADAAPHPPIRSGLAFVRDQPTFICLSPAGSAGKGQDGFRALPSGSGSTPTEASRSEGRSDPPVKPTSEVAHQPGQQRPRLLSLGCCQGGDSMGWHRAGFDVTGVDIDPQPRYPFAFIQGDMMTVPLDGYDAYSAHPPCHDHTPLAALVGKDDTGWMLAAIRDRLLATGKPFALENVPGAPMRADLTLCGHMFRPRLRTRRHRWFELHGFMCWQPPHVHALGVRTATTRRRERWAQGWDVSITGDVGTYVGPEALGVDWMTGDGLSQAIPPAYTEYIGRQLREQIPEPCPAAQGTPL